MQADGASMSDGGSAPCGKLTGATTKKANQTCSINGTVAAFRLTASERLTSPIADLAQRICLVLVVVPDAAGD